MQQEKRDNSYEFAKAQKCLAVACMELGQLLEAEAAATEGRNVLLRLSGKEHHQLPELYYILGVTYKLQGNLPRVTETLRISIDLMKLRPAEYVELLKKAHNSLCYVFLVQQMYSEAEEVVWSII